MLIYEGIATNLLTHRTRAVHVPESRLRHYTLEGVCPCSGPCKCEIEPDGQCPNGWPSKLSALGIV